MELSEYDSMKLDRLELTYGIHRRHFTEGLQKVDSPKLKKNGLFSVYSFFMNPTVNRLLRTSNLPKSEHNKAINMFADEIGTAGGRIHFQEIVPYKEMEQNLAAYVRKRPSLGAKKRLEKALEVMERCHDSLRDVSVVPLLYGSIRYGDSTRFSDLDCKYLSMERDPDAGRVVEDVSCRISDELGANGIDDFHDDLIIDVLEFRATLLDIIDGEANEVDDYKFQGNLFFPYGVVVEGLVPEPFDTTEVDELQETINEAAEADPFFELLLCYHFHNGIRKRKSKTKSRPRTRA